VFRQLRQTARWVPARIGVDVDDTTLDPITVDSQQSTVDIAWESAEDGRQPLRGTLSMTMEGF
jgi:hypothetical protein